MRKTLVALPALLLGFTLSAPAQQQYPERQNPERQNNDRRAPDQNYPAQQQGQRYADTVPVGTNIAVRTNDYIDLRNTSDGRIFTAVVDQDVRDTNGNVVVSRGSNAELIARNIGRNDMALDLESVSVGGRRYIVSTSDQTYNESNRQGVGKNSRTGKYVGGGALLGTIIGAIAGGGRGAAIGAVAGGAAGAGTQVMTRGRDIRVPAESVLTFRLDRPLMVGQIDNGYTRNGQHYHYRQ